MNHKKRSSVLILFLFISITGLYAQQDANAAGGTATGSGGSSSNSVGQVAYSYNTGTGSANQGVQQPYEFFTTGINETSNIVLSMSLFPNPTQSTINLKVENQQWENLTFQLYDALGQQLLSQKIAGALTVVPMQNLASGAYLLKVSDTQKTVKTFTIIKNN
jgi:hypothetical protein